MPDSGLIANKVSVYCGDVKTQNIDIKDKGIQEILMVSQDNMDTMIKNNEINDSLTLSAYYFIEVNNTL